MHSTPLRRVSRLFVSLFSVGLISAAAAAETSVIRIKAGAEKPLVDETGVKWEADRGFTDGETIARPDIPITNTKTPSVYRAERYSMTAFKQALPNGKYVVKLHFSETFEGITGPRERVFSFSVEGKEFKDFDVYVKAGGALKAYVETVNVDIKDGALDITFKSNIENPQINAIEIIPSN